jgi:hypothetical protein
MATKMEDKEQTVEVVQPCLEIDEHLDLQKKGWKLQKIGWLCIAIIMLAGTAGVFGEGPLSDQTKSTGKTTVNYQRFFRHEAEMKILVESANHIASITLTGEYLKNFKVVRFVPEPVNNNTINKAVRYNFLPAENHIVSLYMIPKEFGSINETMKVNEADTFNLRHLIYP